MIYVSSNLVNLNVNAFSSQTTTTFWASGETSCPFYDYDVISLHVNEVYSGGYILRMIRLGHQTGLIGHKSIGLLMACKLHLNPEF